MDSATLFGTVATSDMDQFVIACLGTPAFASMRVESTDTLLHAAVHAKRSDLALWLIHNGCDVNATGECDYTPLHMAALRGLVCVVTELIKLGADINAAEYEGQTPLHKACFVRNRDMAALLIDAGADVNIRDSSGATPLDLLFEDRKLAQLIIARGGAVSETSRIAA